MPIDEKPHPRREQSRREQREREPGHAEGDRPSPLRRDQRNREYGRIEQCSPGQNLGNAKHKHGAPGSGKTTVGGLVAQRLGVGFRDTDVDVEHTAGKTVADVFIDDGEAAFRSFEREAVAAGRFRRGGAGGCGLPAAEHPPAAR